MFCTLAPQQQQQPQATITTKGTPNSTAVTVVDTEWQLECKYTLSEVQQHNTLDDCWMVIFDKVYNITDFVHEHPGGDFILFEYAGRDATHPFLSSRHGSSAYKMLDKYWIGILVDEELYYSNNSSYCSVYMSLSWRSTPVLEEPGGGGGSDEKEANDTASIKTMASNSKITDTNTTTTTRTDTNIKANAQDLSSREGCASEASSGVGDAGSQSDGSSDLSDLLDESDE